MAARLLRIIITACCLFSASCKQSKSKYCKMDLSPNMFFFMVHENGKPLADSINDQLRVFYQYGAQKVYGPPWHINDTSFSFLASSRGWVKPGSKVIGLRYTYERERWYLEYPNGNLDTIDIEVGELACEEARKDRCRCYGPYTNVRFNGVAANEYTGEENADGKIMFLFGK